MFLEKSTIRASAMQMRQTISQLAPSPTPPLTKAWTAQPHTRDLQRTQASHVEWVQYTILLLHYRYANLYYTILLRTTRRVGVLKDLLDHYHSLVLTISFLICATSVLT